MKCVIVGGEGFIGRPLAERLAGAGHQVTVADVRAPILPHPDINYCKGSYIDPDFCRQILTGQEICFHLASTTTPGTAERDMGFDLNTNVGATLGLLEGCMASAVRRVVFLSSGGTVYGPPEWTPTPESHPLRPICAYGVSKVSIENYLRVYKVTRGLDYKIIRLSNPYGPRQSTSGGQGVIPIFIRRAMDREAIEIWGDGSVVRDFIYIDDAVEAIVATAFQDTPQDVYNVGSGAGVSINEILAVIGEVVGRQPDVRYVQSRSFDVPASILDCGAIRRDIGWTPAIDLLNGMTRTWRHLLSSEQNSLIGS